MKTQKKIHRFLMKTNFILVFAVLLGTLSSCGKRSTPRFIYMPDMYYTPGIKAQSEGVRTPVAGTISRERKVLPESMTQEEAGKVLVNPLRKTENVLARGKNRFETYCLVCHGSSGMGDGTIVPKFGRPPSLQADRARTIADGTIFHIITRGQNRMPSYASQIPEADRWAIIHYVRALQRAYHPSDADMKAAE